MPQGRDIPLLLLGIIGIGTSGPIIALSLMPILTLIFWRNLAGALILSPFAFREYLSERREDPVTDRRRGLLLSVAAGISLSLHFIGFFLSMRLTTVAAGTALAALQPIFAAYFMVRLGGHIPRRAWIGMAISFLGVVIITGVDFQISTRAFLGDLAAIACAALAALYLTIGAHAQRSVPTSMYTSLCFFSCALVTFPCAVILDKNLVSYPFREWMLLLGLIAGAQILGHTLFNITLKRISPAIISLVVFFEVPVSAILAYLWIGQLPSSGTIPGLMLLLVGCIIFVSRNRVSQSE